MGGVSRSRGMSISSGWRPGALKLDHPLPVGAIFEYRARSTQVDGTTPLYRISEMTDHEVVGGVCSGSSLISRGRKPSSEIDGELPVDHLLVRLSEQALGLTRRFETDHPNVLGIVGAKLVRSDDEGTGLDRVREPVLHELDQRASSHTLANTRPRVGVHVRSKRPGVVALCGVERTRITDVLLRDSRGGRIDRSRDHRSVGAKTTQKRGWKFAHARNISERADGMRET